MGPDSAVNPGLSPWYNLPMSNPDLLAAAATARTHVNAAVDALLAPLRGSDGNCRRPDPNNAAEMAAWRAYQALKPLTQDDTGNHGRGLLADLERAAR